MSLKISCAADLQRRSCSIDMASIGLSPKYLATILRAFVTAARCVRPMSIENNHHGEACCVVVIFEILARRSAIIRHRHQQASFGVAVAGSGEYVAREVRKMLKYGNRQLWQASRLIGGIVVWRARAVLLVEETLRSSAAFNCAGWLAVGLGAGGGERRAA